VTAGTRRLRFLPPFLTGLAAAVTLETSTGLLLYADAGLLPALTMILTVEVGSLGLGVWVGPMTTSGGIVDQVRRRWLFCLVSFAVASALSAGMTFVDGLAGTGLGQGLGLALLGSLPLFAIGALLGIMNRTDGFGARPLAPIGGPAVLGAAAGFLVTGVMLIPNAAAYTLYLLALALLSAGALSQGRLLESWVIVSTLESVTGPTGELRAERRETGGSKSSLTVLVEGGRLRGAEDGEGNPARSWEKTVLDGLILGEGVSGSILFLGGGSGTLAHLAPLRKFPARILLVERSRKLIDLAVSQLHSKEERDDIARLVGDPLDVPLEAGSSFSLVLVDAGVLPGLGTVPILEERHWRFLADMSGEEGLVILGGLRGGESGRNEAVEDLLQQASRHFENALLYGVMPGWKDTLLLPELGGEDERLVALGAAGRAAWPLLLPGFRILSPPGA